MMEIELLSAETIEGLVEVEKVATEQWYFYRSLADRVPAKER